MLIRNLLILILFLNNPLFSKDVDISLRQFVNIVSTEYKINILISNDIEADTFAFQYDPDNKAKLFLVLQKSLYIKGYLLTYDEKGNFYYIIKRSADETKRLYAYRLQAPLYEQIKSTLDNLSVKYSYIPTTNVLTLFTDFETYKDVIKILDSNVVRPSQYLIKMTILETNINDVKERGFNLSAVVQGATPDLSYYVNLLTMPYTTITPLTSSTASFYSAVRYLDENGLSDLKSSPYMLVQSGKDIYFSAVQNVPYQTSTISVNGASSSQSETINYKDVGLKIKLHPQQVDDIVYCDLDFTIESLIDKSSLTPSTSKRQLNTSFQLKNKELIVLSGITQIEDQSTDYSVPFLSSIPFFGSLFTYHKNEKIKRSISISIELVKRLSDGGSLAVSSAS